LDDKLVIQHFHHIHIRSDIQDVFFKFQYIKQYIILVFSVIQELRTLIQESNKSN